MRYLTGFLLAGLIGLTALPTLAKDAPPDEEKPPTAEKSEKSEKSAKKTGYFEADRAGWLMGMFIGEQAGQPYPIIFQVSPRTEAQNVGIRPGDELIKFQDEPTMPLKRLFQRVTDTKAGRYVKLWVRRGSQTLQFEMRMPENPGAAPDPEQAAKKKSKDGDSDADGKEKKKKKKKKRPPVVIKPIPASS